MTKNLFEIVTTESGLKTIKETKTNYVLPIRYLKALCILLNYVAMNGDVPSDVDTMNWWNKPEYQKYLIGDGE